MGIIEIFGTVIRSGTVRSSITQRWSKKLPINHLFLDFNSMIHNEYPLVLAEINGFMKQLLASRFKNQSLHGKLNHVMYDKYGIDKTKISDKMDVRDIIDIFTNTFTQKLLDKLIITRVINTILYIVRTYTKNSEIRTLMIAIDGVPSKGKLMEQRQRGYFGAVIDEYKNIIRHSYKEYLNNQENYLYLFIKNQIK